MEHETSVLVAFSFSLFFDLFSFVHLSFLLAVDIDIFSHCLSEIFHALHESDRC